MKKLFFPLAALFFALLVGPLQAAAQSSDSTRTYEVALSAARLEQTMVDGETVRRLTGNVRLREEKTTLTSDGATQYPARNTILFVGNVLIVDEGDSLWADRVLYHRGTRIGEAHGSVRLSDGDVRLDAPDGIYYLREKRAELTGGVQMQDSISVLTSRRGRYWMDDKRAEFFDTVRLAREDSRTESDSLVYRRESEIALAYGRVVVEQFGDGRESADSLARTLLFGAEAYNDNRAGYSRMTGEPLLVRIEVDSTGEGTDTLLVAARMLESFRADSITRVVGIDEVRVLQGSLSALADSLVSEQREASDQDSLGSSENIRLFGTPMVWYEKSQISGDSVRVRARDRSVDSLFVYGNAFVAQEDTTVERIQQLKGRALVATVENDSLRTLTVAPNAEMIRFMADDAGSLKGAVKVTGDEAFFFFSGGELRRSRVSGNPEGEQYDAGIIPDPFTLEGYQWVPERRPERDDLLARSGSWGKDVPSLDEETPVPDVLPDIVQSPAPPATTVPVLGGEETRP